MAKGKTTAPKSRGKSGRSSRGRRGKGEAFTAKKENAVEMRKAGELDLQRVEIDDADFDLHFRAAKSAKETAEKYQSLYRSQLKAAKKVSPALAEAVKWALGAEGKDAGDIKREMEIRGYVLKRQGSPIQLTIHDTLAGDVNEAAETAGYRDAKAGKVSSSPYPAGSDLDALYSKGWKRGTVENMGLTGDDAAKVLQSDGPFPLDHNAKGNGEAATLQ